MRFKTIMPENYQENSALMHEMFVHRKIQFKDRLEWDVNVSARGEERDQYDSLRPLYLIAQGNDGSHIASMRFLPMVGPTMLFDYFGELVPSGFEMNKNEFECTRFCIAPNLERRVAALAISLLLLEGCRLAMKVNCPSTIGIFHPSMLKIYRAAGWSPQVLAIKEICGGTLLLGRWKVSSECERNLRNKVKILKSKMVTGEREIVRVV